MSLLWVAIPLLIIEFAIILAAAQPKTNRVQQHEGDIRLPYKRYKELYPSSRLSYAEYKHMQSREAFKHSISSKQLKRMVH